MKRYEFERALYESGMSAPSKQVLAYMAFRKNWEKGTYAFPSLDKISEETGLSRRTVQRHVKGVIESGWLIDTKTVTATGTKKYDLAVGVAVTPPVVGVTPPSDSLTPPMVSVTTQVGQSDLQTSKEQVNEHVIEEVIELDGGSVVDQQPTSPYGSATVAALPEIREERKTKESTFSNRVAGGLSGFNRFQQDQLSSNPSLQDAFNAEDESVPKVIAGPQDRPKNASESHIDRLIRKDLERRNSPKPESEWDRMVREANERQRVGLAEDAAETGGSSGPVTDEDWISEAKAEHA